MTVKTEDVKPVWQLVYPELSQYPNLALITIHLGGYPIFEFLLEKRGENAIETQLNRWLNENQSKIENAIKYVCTMYGWTYFDIGEPVLDRVGKNWQGPQWRKVFYSVSEFLPKYLLMKIEEKLTKHREELLTGTITDALKRELEELAHAKSTQTW